MATEPTSRSLPADGSAATRISRMRRELFSISLFSFSVGSLVPHWRKEALSLALSNAASEGFWALAAPMTSVAINEVRADAKISLRFIQTPPSNRVRGVSPVVGQRVVRTQQMVTLAPKMMPPIYANERPSMPGRGSPPTKTIKEMVSGYNKFRGRAQRLTPPARQKKYRVKISLPRRAGRAQGECETVCLGVSGRGGEV